MGAVACLVAAGLGLLVTTHRNAARLGRRLVLADPSYPQWTVTVDGARADLLRVDHAFKGVVVPAGTHTVVFAYDDRATEYGAVLARAEALAAELRQAETSLAEVRATLDAERTASIDRIAAERQATAEKLALLEQTQDKIKEQFTALSSEALARNNSQFLELAGTHFKAAGLPITESLNKVETQLKELEATRIRSQAVLGEQIEQVKITGERLKHETASLVSALRKPEARGRWGELQLKRVVELAGMTDRCDFAEQESVNTADGKLRPDVVVKLVGTKTVVVDSKVTLSAYLEAYEATDDSVREERLTAHARHLRKHVDDLAAKSYWTQFSPAPEFVVLFVPGEAFLAPALERDRDLLEHAFGKRVHIATPTTLISLLRTVAYGWQQEALTDNAKLVFDYGRELYERLSVMGGHIDRLGRQITGTVKAYNDTVGSLETRVLVTARKLNELAVVEGELATPSAVEIGPKPLTAGELLEAATPGRPQLVLPDPDAIDGSDEAVAG